MANEPDDEKPLAEKLLFYTTASFVLLATFSLFAFLFLVPFVIEPAFTTIYMEFNETPAICETSIVLQDRGQTNCSFPKGWTSCKEGCTKDVYSCKQIYVNYQLGGVNNIIEPTAIPRVARAIRADYIDNYDVAPENIEEEERDLELGGSDDDEDEFGVKYGLQPNGSKWYFTRAKLFPNVKGCGYPPMLNCTIWIEEHEIEGAKFKCFYSIIDNNIVITDLDMHQVYLNLVLAMAIPIPSFIISVIYLAVAYFFIYNEEPTIVTEKEINLDSRRGSNIKETTPLGTPSVAPTSLALTPASEIFREDMASFGHQLKVAMADDLSRDSVFTDTMHISTNSLNGSSNRMMTTSIVTPPGPIADV